MSDAVEIAGMSEMEMMEKLKEKSDEYFKDLKHLPNPVASKLYKDFPRRWKLLEDRVKVLEELVKSVKWEDKSVEENRYDIATELVDKAMQGFEIYDEHLDRRVPIGHRLVLESRLLTSMKHAFDRVEGIMRDFYGKDQFYANNERDDLRLEIRMLDATYTEVHTFFLQSYLEMEWGF
ncbi:hypothetical protein M3Y98_00627200 [Aphelenchoides besseyi]|nr:hypothetical protein M3Y98_00627200 [Aphelenchoides besseyi]KAI6208439.1 hypothetical protein M3Y96_00115500 [Aphelenchoides besseyi]